MTTDFRALCAELADLLNRLHSVVWAEASQLLNEDSGGSEELDLAIEDALTSARAALAAPEQGPTEQDACDVYDYAYRESAGLPHVGLGPVGVTDHHRAAIRAVAQHLGRPAVEPVPVSERLPGPEQGPTEADLFLKIDAMLDGIDRHNSDPKGGWWETSDGARFGRIKLRELKELIVEHQQGRLQSKPVPVSEWLPGPLDCDDQGRCWWYDPLVMPGWLLMPKKKCSGAQTHWAPHWALPVPQEGADG
jgi:hypothetical protein